MTVVESNVQCCQSKLRLWSKTSFGNITRDLIKKKKKLRVAEEEAVKGGSVDRVHVVKSELRELMVNEE